MKKLLTTLCVLTLVVACLLVLPTRAEAATEGCYTYDVVNGEAIITDYTYNYGTDKNVVIPSYLGGYPVTAIGDNAFDSTYSLESVVIPEGVTKIGKYAFYYSGIAAVTIPSTVTTIDEGAFKSCGNLTAVTIPDGVETIGKHAFYNGIFTSLELGNSVTSIGEGAFYSCDNLTSLTIPASVQTIDKSAFEYCENLTQVVIGGGNIGEGAFYLCEKLSSVTLGSGVKSIGKNAFRNCDALKALSIPGNVETIHECAFWYSKLEQVVINAKVIGESAFYGCENLTSVTFGNNVKTIGNFAFAYSTAVTSVAIPNSVTTLGEQAFAGCDGLTTVSIGNGVSAISQGAFISCDSLAVIKLGSGVKSIDEDAFENCISLKTVSIPDSVITIGKDAFSWCSGMTSVVIGQGVTTIGEYAFYDCENLTTVTLGRSISTIEDCAFLACYKIKTVNYFGNKASWDKINIVGYCNDSIKEATRKYVAVATIVTQPKNAAAPNGKTAKITVKASGSGLTYTWYHKNAKAAKYSKSSVTGATYAVKVTSAVHGRYVFCVVKDRNGVTVTSNVVRVYMGNPATIKTQPKNVAVANKKTAKVTVKATGDGLKYQWYYAAKGSSSFKKLSGATKATYSVKMSSKVNGRKVYCMITDKYGISVKTSTVTLSIKQALKIKTQPTNGYAVKNGKASVTVAATGDGLKYQWYYAAKGSSSFKKISGATKATYSVKMTSKVNGRKVYCLVRDAYGKSVKTGTVTLKLIDAKKVVAGNYKSTYQVNPDGKKVKDATMTFKITSAGKVTLKSSAATSMHKKGTFKYTLKYVKMVGNVVHYKFTNKTETLAITYDVAKDQLAIVAGGYQFLFKSK